MFYAKNIAGSAGTNTITVTLQGPIPGGTSVPSFGIVIAEYSGLDQNYPLDSVSEAISSTTSAILDSGTAVPANWNLLVFGAGDTDAGTASLTTSSPFVLVQSSGGNITEQNIVSASSSLPLGNNTLQRASAASTASGNWLMQIGVFRGASQTPAQGTSSTRFHGDVYADQFPGVDIGDQIRHAISSLPSGGVVHIPPGTYNFATQISPTTIVTIVGAGASYDNNGTHCATTLVWTGTGIPISLSGTGPSGSVLADFCLYASSAASSVPVLIDIDAGVGNTTLRNINIDYNTLSGKLQATVAAIRYGNSSPLVNQTECDHVFVQDAAAAPPPPPLTPVPQFLVLDVSEFKGYSCRGLSDTSGDNAFGWQLGNGTMEVKNFNCFGCAATANNSNTSAIVIDYVDNASFYGLYCEQNGASGHCINVPITAEDATNLNVFGGRSKSQNGGTSAVYTDFNKTKIGIYGFEMVPNTGDWAATSYLVDDVSCAAVAALGANVVPPGGQTFSHSGSCVETDVGNVVAAGVGTGATLPSVGLAGALSLGATTVGHLPSASVNPGAVYYVTDSTGIGSEGQPCAGGGTSLALAFSNGGGWKCF
jgi:hypothetical protein